MQIRHYGIAALAAVILSVPAVDAADLITVEIKADAMCCAGCAKKVSAQLFTAPGVIEVKPDVPSRMVEITARPSRNLTMEKLWNAVEKAKGKPSSLAVGGTTYEFTPIDPAPADKPAPNQYQILLDKESPLSGVASAAKAVQQLRGVGQVSVATDHSQLTVAPAQGSKLSAWALLGVLEQAQVRVTQIDGPAGRIAIQQKKADKSVTTRPQGQGVVR